MKLSKRAEEEIRKLGGSETFRKDIETLRSTWETPFLRDGGTDPDAYIEFVSSFNRFINHKPKPLRPMIDRVMKL